MIRAVLFDLDGLLIDSEIIFYKIYEKLLASYGHDFPMSDYLRSYSGQPIRAIAAAFVNDYALPLSVDEAAAHIEKAEELARASGVELKPGARELLDYLSAGGYRLAIATSSKRDRALSILSAHGIADCFDTGVFAENIHRGKPDPEVFLLAASRLGVAPTDCLVLEDSSMGIEAAHAAGIPVICVPDKKMPDEDHRAMTVAVLDSLHDVSGFLDEARAAE